MGRKIRAVDAKTGRPAEFDADAGGPGPIRNATLPEPLLRRIRAVHGRIRGVYSVTLEQFEVNFMRDADPAGEVALWERIADAFEAARRGLPDLDPTMILRTLLAYSMDALTHAERADPDVRRVLAAVGEPP